MSLIRYLLLVTLLWVAAPAWGQSPTTNSDELRKALQDAYSGTQTGPAREFRPAPEITAEQRASRENRETSRENREASRENREASRETSSENREARRETSSEPGPTVGSESAETPSGGGQFVPPSAVRIARNPANWRPADSPVGISDQPAMPAALQPAEPLVVRQDSGADQEARAPQTKPAEKPVSAGPVPWWQRIVCEPTGDRQHEQIFPDMLVQFAMHNSPSILAISQNPLIQETEIKFARAKFDTDLFLRTQYDDRTDPVGNQLTTGGGLPFLKDNIWYGEGGLRRKLYSGGDLELKQRLGFQNSNSNFFDPQDQGTATLSINFSQPLMRGRGKYYNRSQIMIAQTGANVAWDKLAAELQDELTRLVEAYWTLYYSRAILLQKRQNVERGQVVLLKLEGRSGLDSLPSQIARARAAVRARATELANSQRDVRDAETEIRRILGSPEAFRSNAPELVPGEPPLLTPNRQDLENIITQAMQERPEVKQAVQRAKIAAIQQNVSRNEMMPELNLIFNTYVSALRGESDIAGSWSEQFTNSTPGFATGLEFAMPWGRRAARARLTRQQLVVEQVRHEIDQVMHQVVAEAQIAWRQVDSAFQTALAAGSAIEAARADLLQNEVRWESFALVEGDLTEGQTPTTLLDQLLDAQQRLTNAELTYSQALLEFKVAEIALKRANGTLLNFYDAPIEGDYQATKVVIEPSNAVVEPIDGFSRQSAAQQ